MKEEIRIEKFLSEEGICSRREAKKLLQEGFIFLDGKVLAPGDKIQKREAKKLFIKENPLMQEKKTVAVYKPRGVLSSKDQGNGKNIFDVFPQFKDLHTVGRLDKESEGLILLSNDGLVTKAVTGKDHKIEKEYLVEVREEILPWMMQKMSQGMQLEDGWTLPARAEKIKTHLFRIVLREGRKHQIRRMANACRLTVLSLKRVRIHEIRLGAMKAGNFRFLRKEEVDALKKYAKKQRSN